MKKITVLLLFCISTIAIYAQATPVLTAPANHVYTQRILPLLSWAASGTGGPYTLEIYKDAAMTNVVLTQTPIVPTSYTLIVPLDYNTKYYWRVRDAALTNWSDLWEFTTKLDAKPNLVMPSNASTPYSTSVTLNWYSSIVNAVYDIQFGTEAPFGDMATYTTAAGTSYKMLDNLISGQIYHWRVRTRQVNNYSDWSDTWTFTISASTGAVKPIATYPTGGSTVYTNEPYVYWYTTSTATGLLYDVQLKEGVGGMYAPVATDQTPVFVKLTGLKASTTYFWQARSKKGATISDWSDEVSFVTSSTIPGSPIKPTISWPSGDALIYGSSTSLNWYLGNASTGMTFEYELLPAASPFTGTPTVVGITNLYVEATGLTAATNYKWQVRSRIGVATSAWSDPATFSTVAASNATPVVPILSWPTGGASVYTINPYLNWYTDSYVAGTEYQVQYNTVNTFTDIVPAPIVTANLFTTLSSLTPGTTYYWRARQRLVATPATTSAWSASTSFVVVSNSNEGPQKPVIDVPVGNSVVYSKKPTLGWHIVGSPSLIKYELQHKLDSQDWTAATTVINLSATTYTMPTDLTAGEMYRWRVRSVYNTTQNSAWSDEAVFVVDAGAAAMLPIAGSPANGIQVQETSVKLSWFVPAKSEGLKYTVVVADNAKMENPVVKAENLSTPFYQAKLNNNKTYYWAIKSISQDGKESNYSKKGVFGIASVTGIETERIPTEYSLDQNYPNPFNPATIINYSLPSNSFVTLRVYDMLGREVKTLLSSEVVAGKHSIEWRGDDNFGNRVSTGVYVYRISANNYVSSRKMLLVK